MTAPTRTAFDFAAFQRALEAWDLDALLELYDGDVELRQIDKESPPSSPRIVRGKAALEEIYREIATRGLDSRIGDVVSGDDRVAYAVTCRYPTGECVYSQSMLDVRDGRIVRQVEVQAWDE